MIIIWAIIAIMIQHVSISLFFSFSGTIWLHDAVIRSNVDLISFIRIEFFFAFCMCLLIHALVINAQCVIRMAIVEKITAYNRNGTDRDVCGCNDIDYTISLLF